LQLLGSLSNEDIVPAAESAIHEILIRISALSIIELVLPSLLSALSFHYFIDNGVIVIITTIASIIVTAIITTIITIV
jgi:hypothetical protein